MDTETLLVTDMQKRLLAKEPEPETDPLKRDFAIIEQFKPQNDSYPPRLGIDIVGPGITSGPIAMLQMFDEITGGRGETPEQLDRNQPIRSQLYRQFLKEHPEEIGKLRERQPYNQTDRRMLSEDLNSVKIKFDNWRKRRTGQELTPQERVTESFVDTRNPNSRF